MGDPQGLGADAVDRHRRVTQFTAQRGPQRPASHSGSERLRRSSVLGIKVLRRMFHQHVRLLAYGYVLHFPLLSPHQVRRKAGARRSGTPRPLPPSWKKGQPSIGIDDARLIVRVIAPPLAW